MKKLLFLFLTLFNFVFAIAQLEPYPSLKEVVEEFDSKYTYVSNGSEWLRLSKSPKGWVVYELYYDNGGYKTRNEQVLWDRNIKSYQPLIEPYTKATIKSESLKNAASDDAYNFERNYYYGYDGDNMDVIRELGMKKNLSDTLLDALARAYSSQSRSFVQNETNFKYEILHGEKIPENLADSFMLYVDKAIETFGRLVKQAPHYETIVGNIYMKWCNEHIYAYTTLAEWGYEEKGRKYLVDGLYGETLLDMARNYFFSMEDNSIFLSWGDNDTYPLIYLQLKFGFKKNVNVVNIALLGAPRFIEMVRNGYGGLPKVKMTLPQEAYNSGKLNYIGINKTVVAGEADTHTLEDIIKKVAGSYNTVNSVNAEYLTFTINGDGFKMPVNKGYCIANNLLEPDGDNPDEIEIGVNKGVYQSGLAVLDIIHSNNWERTVYFAEGYDDLNMGHHLRVTGLVKLLHPEKAEETYPGAIDEARLYKNVMDRFVFSNKNRYVGSKGYGFKLNVSNLRKAYSTLASKTDDKKRKAEVARKGLAIVSNSYTPYNEMSILLGEELAKSGNVAGAEKELIITANSMYEDFINPQIVYQFWYDKNYEEERVKAFLNYINEIAGNYDMKELKETLKSIAEKMDGE